jgi:hypothetical protein
MDKFLLSKVGGSANNAVPLELADLHRVVRYLLGRGIELGVVLARATVTAAIALED